MRKFFVAVLAVVSLSAIPVCAQTSSVKYQGEIDLGYSIGVGEWASSRLNIHTIQGMKVCDYFSTGIGLGLDYYTQEDGEVSFIPIYLNMKGYLPVSEKTAPYLSVDLGVGFGVSEAMSGLSGFYFTPAFGIKADKFKAQIGYNVQRIVYSDYDVSIGANAVQLKVGVMF